MSRPLRMGLIGLGNIGCGVVQALRDNRDLLDARCPRPLELARVADIDLERPRPVEVERGLLTKDPEWVIADREIDVVVELIGGIEPARTLVESALNAGKHVVTANKAMLAQHGAELLALAKEKGVRLLFEAAVGGGVPVIRVLTECLAANRITRIEGILNGTCNFILGEMYGACSSFEAAVAEAQRQGYAEPDPTADVESIDAANKIAILASLAFGCDIRYEDVAREGITKLTPRDLDWIWQSGVAGGIRFVVKQYALARKDPEGRVSVSVRPALLSWETRPLARLGQELNGVHIQGDLVGRIFLSGPGAGPTPTASAVLSDLMWLSQIEAGQLPPPPFLTIPIGKKPPRADTAFDYNGYYVRILSRRLDEDRIPGVLAILARHGIRTLNVSEIQHGRDTETTTALRLTQVWTWSVSEETMSRAIADVRSSGLSDPDNEVLCMPVV